MGLCLILAGWSANAQEQLDILLRGGRLIDGSGSTERIADVGIRAQRIVFVGDASKTPVKAKRTLNCAGLIVAPGFIDPHAHVLEDLSDTKRRNNENYLLQGVTTVITGNDGAGPFAIARLKSRWQASGLGTNAMIFAGYGPIRREVMGMSAAEPTAAQLEQMKRLMARAMEEGAIGLSTGLFYAPQSFGKTEEVIELAKVVARYKGLYDSHLRDESSYTIGLKGAVEEALRIGREAGVPVHIAHIKALGADVWGKSDEIIELIKRAQAGGLRVTADQYPYTASGTSLGACLLPRWAQEGGRAKLLERMNDAAIRPKLLVEMKENLRRRGGPDSILLLTPKDPSMTGKTLAAVAKAQHKDSIETAVEILKVSEAGVASFNMQEEDIERFMKEPWVMTGSDGSAGHPRKFGTFPRKIRRYVFERKTLTLEEAIRKSTSLPAATFGLTERGLLQENYWADIVVFDPATIRDRSTYEQPEILSEGVRHVLINGALAVENGRYLGTLAGRVMGRN